MPDQPILPGMEEFAEEEEHFTEGPPRKGVTHFDASVLPDAPGYQPSANGAQVYTLFVLFESYEELKRGLLALSGGKRVSLSTVARMATVSASREVEEGRTYLQHWEERLLDANPRPRMSAAPKQRRAAAGEIPVIEKYAPLKLENSNVRFAFPTYKRCGNVTTFEHFPDGTALAYVEPSEKKVYTALHRGQEFRVYSVNGMNISQKRRHILEEAMRDGIRWLFMLEDDLKGFYVRDGLTAGGSHKLTRSDYKTVTEMMLSFAQANDVAELGLSQQQSNHYYEETLVKYSCKVTEFCLFDLHKLKEAGVNYDPDLLHFEDFDISVQLLQKGYKVGLFTPAAFGHVTMGTNSGGHQDTDRKPNAVAGVQRMMEKFPGIVQMKEGRLFPEPKVEWGILRREIT